MGKTAVPGVWLAGNVAEVTAGDMQSEASGVTAAAAINADLTSEDVANALQTQLNSIRFSFSLPGGLRSYVSTSP